MIQVTNHSYMLREKKKEKLYTYTDIPIMNSIKK